jgi:hypothetical protein
MKLLLENWRKFIVESNKRTGILNSNHTGEVYAFALSSPNMETVKAGAKGQEVEIISGWQDQGVEWKLINVEVWDEDIEKLVAVEGWIDADAIDIDEEVIDESEEYCPACIETMDEAKKKSCNPSKGKRFAKRVDGKCRSYGQAGQAKSGGDRIRPGTKKGDAYCARSAGIKKCKNPPCANTLSRKKWKCRGKKSMKQE